MSGTFKPGENKIRPGSYYRYTNSGDDQAAVRGGTVGLAFSASYGPLNEVVSITAARDIAAIYGSGGGEDAIKLLLRGGASVVKCVRVGSGGTKETYDVKDTTSTPAKVAKLTAKHPGIMSMAATIRDNVTDATKRDLLITSGTVQLARFTYIKGEDEARAMVDAVNADVSAPVVAEYIAAGDGTLATISQAAFTGGAKPTVTTEDYDTGFAALESTRFDIAVVDSNDTAVHALLLAFATRMVNAGSMCFAVCGQPISVAYDARIEAARTFNSVDMIYVLNGGYDADDVLIDGYRAAALIAGLVAATPSSAAITHRQVPGLIRLAGGLSGDQIEECIVSGALVLSLSQSGLVWVEVGINTLNALNQDQDSGWKKIRRAKTRYELITRINDHVEPLIGQINNDKNGRSTIIGKAQGVIGAMIGEGKLISGAIIEDPANPPVGDSAWFVLEIADLDSIEKCYFTYGFSYSGV